MSRRTRRDIGDVTSDGWERMVEAEEDLAGRCKNQTPVV
jgi:hypothetical protein